MNREKFKQRWHARGLLGLVSYVSLILATCFVAGVSAQFTRPASEQAASGWSVIRGSDGFEVTAEGDPQTDGGAFVSVRSIVPPPNGKFGGAIWKADAVSVRGRVLKLSAVLRGSPDGSRGAIWIRVDGESARISFATSANDRVPLTSQPSTKEISLVVPQAATSFSYGVVLASEGEVGAEKLRLRTMNEPTSPVTANELLEKAIAVIELNAFYGKSVDWVAFRQKHQPKLLGEKRARAAYPAIDEAILLLGDNHSRLVRAEDAQLAAARAGPTFPAAVEAMQDVSIGYIKLYGFHGNDLLKSKEFSQEVASQICSLDPQAKRGWIIDLRDNSGGNLWPMLASLKPLLGSGVIGIFERASGERISWHSGDNLPSDVALDCKDLRTKPVAILVGAKTASAGEIVAIAFQGRSLSRSFGERTAGMATGNSTFRLPDGSVLALTTSITLDRNLRPSSRVFVPEVLIPEVESSDSAMTAARGWLLTEVFSNPQELDRSHD